MYFAKIFFTFAIRNAQVAELVDLSAVLIEIVES